jgi:hypothetical protein
VRENRPLRLRWRVLETGSFGAPRQHSTLRVSGEGRRVQWETKQSHPGKSQTPVAKVAGAEETNPLKPT